ncbi:MAG: double-cubane-cluster-containing anaerobic reductase [Syntrophaceae bacterium]
MNFNRPDTQHLINDEFSGEATKRVLGYLQSKRKAGLPVAGTYCGYAPLEIVRAAGAVPAILCAFANKTISAAEAVLPGNLCPLIKSSYGFIATDSCPFFALSDVVIAETTCDGKKKMFELISEYKPMHVMDLPQIPEDGQAVNNWAYMIRKVEAFLARTFQCSISDARIEEEIRASNFKNGLMRRIYEFAAERPPLLSWGEAYELGLLAQVASTADVALILEKAIRDLDRRKAGSIHYGSKDSIRVLVTGCPVGGDSLKVYKIIEEAGGVVVAMDACTGMKPFMEDIEEGTGNPVYALARRYLKLPCSCMSPNMRRLDELDRLIGWFKPAAVIDVVLHACHSYNIESYKIMNHVKEKHGIGFLKIETDYSDGDIEQIRTRVEALFESLS